MHVCTLYALPLPPGRTCICTSNGRPAAPQSHAHRATATGVRARTIPTAALRTRRLLRAAHARFKGVKGAAGGGTGSCSGAGKRSGIKRSSVGGSDGTCGGRIAAAVMWANGGAQRGKVCTAWPVVVQTTPQCSVRMRGHEHPEGGVQRKHK
ncbi:hypothetical protein JKP88DRAFT_216909 [Tribonema minus]|uniref:Uncharacterized protein n=1 Tax=Tribonema minus TaxID=303371 RepID=A0A835ZH53_9STRA|nr:hypothetical protein JKP88DRAFT_216909 [Tribonema minus]